MLTIYLATVPALFQPPASMIWGRVAPHLTRSCAEPTRVGDPCSINLNFDWPTRQALSFRMRLSDMAEALADVAVAADVAEHEACLKGVCADTKTCLGPTEPSATSSCALCMWGSTWRVGRDHLVCLDLRMMTYPRLSALIAKSCQVRAGSSDALSCLLGPRSLRHRQLC